MIPVNCVVRHNPPETFGDCLRACVASVLELDGANVPHFADGGADGEQMMQRLTEFLAPMKLHPVVVSFDGSVSLTDMLEIWKNSAGDSHAVMFCYSGGSDHAVIVSGGRVVHNPAWYRCAIEGATSLGWWQFLVFARK